MSEENTKPEQNVDNTKEIDPEIINFKLEGVVVGILALIFAIVCRVTQYSEIQRVFILKTELSVFKFHVLMIISFMLLWIFFGFLLWMVFELGRWKHEKCVRFIKFFLIYFLIQCVILFLVWPGIFKQDELYLLFFTISDIRIVWVQSLITQIFYWLAIAMFPYVASLTFFQIVIISLLAAATLKTVWDNIEHKKLTYLLYIPFLFLPVLDNNQFNIRNSQIAWFFMYLVISFYFEYKKNKQFTAKKSLLFLTIAVILGVWKTEFLYLVPCLFLIILVVNYKKDKWKSLFFIPVVIVIYLLCSLPNRLWQPDDDPYVLTAVMTPLSDILATHYGDYDEKIADDLEVIDEWIPIEEICETTVFYGTPDVYWEKGNVENKKQLNDVLMASIDILLQYPIDFLYNRIEVYKRTNGFVPNIINHGDVTQWKQEMDIGGEDFYNYYFRFTNLGHTDLRNTVITFLACREQGNYIKTNALYPIFYNSFWGLIGLIALMILRFIKKDWFSACLIGTVILQVPIVFLFAPSNMFMYYMPFYLTSATLIFLTLIEKLNLYFIKLGKDN